MSQWPRRTLNWVCRDQRVNAVDPHVAKVLIDREVSDLKELERMADNAGINPESVRSKRRLLEESDTSDILTALEKAYRYEYSDSERLECDCPFEETGLDKGCWSCPVAGDAYEILRDMLEEDLNKIES